MPQKQNNFYHLNHQSFFIYNLNQYGTLYQWGNCLVPRGPCTLIHILIHDLLLFSTIIRLCPERKETWRIDRWNVASWTLLGAPMLIRRSLTIKLIHSLHSACMMIISILNSISWSASLEQHLLISILINISWSASPGQLHLISITCVAYAEFFSGFNQPTCQNLDVGAKYKINQSDTGLAMWCWAQKGM